MKDFSGKVAVITGGASGIGLAVARRLAREGAKLVLADIEQVTLDAAVNEFEAARHDVIGVLTDVRERASVQALADAAWTRFGAVHFVMHNAGVVVFGPAWELTDKDWDWTLQVNLNGVIYGVQAFLPRMVREGCEGHMLFTASFAGLVANKNLSPYNVTKAAVVALAESLAKDLRKTQIGVSVLCPMIVESRIYSSARNRPDDLGGQSANRSYTQDELDNLQGRILHVEPVADLVVEAVGRNDLYIHTHSEAETMVRKRMEGMLSSFEHAL